MYSVKIAAFVVAFCLAGTGAYAQSAPSAGELSPPPAAVEGSKLGECNKQADAQEMTGEARNIWIADCVKQEKSKTGGN